MKVFFIIVFAITTIALICHSQVRAYLNGKFSINLSKDNYIRGLVLSMTAFVFVVCFSAYQINKSDYGAKEEDNNYIEVATAYNTAKDAVLQHLKAPSTASFAKMTDPEAKYRINDDGSVLIRSYVDAENSFGAKVRTHFQCTIKDNNVSDLSTW